MENEENLLPKPELDLPLPEKEISEHATPAFQGDALEDHALQNQKANILKNKFFLGFVALSILIAFLIGGLTLGNNSSKQSPLGSPKPTAEAATPDPTADWKTYIETGNAYGLVDSWSGGMSKGKTFIPLSFSYPKNWTRRDSVFYNENDIKIAELSPGSVIMQDGRKCFDSKFNAEEVEGKPISQEPITINNYEGVKRIISVENYAIEYCISSGNKAFTVNFYEETLGSDLEKIFNDTISTFKFTDSSSDTSTWKTYTNDAYGVSIDYPPDWKIQTDTHSKDIQDYIVFEIVKNKGDYAITLSLLKNFQGDYCNGANATKTPITLTNGIVGEQIKCDGMTIAINYKIGQDNYWLLSNQNVLTGKDRESLEKMFSTFKFTQ